MYTIIYICEEKECAEVVNKKDLKTRLEDLIFVAGCKVKWVFKGKRIEFKNAIEIEGL